METNDFYDLYHSSRIKFISFDPAYYKTGEGAGAYEGWYFCVTQAGALHHCISYLRCDLEKDEGYIYHCRVQKIHVDEDIDGVSTDAMYGRPIHGVSLKYSQNIVIVRVIPAREMYERLYGAND